jgi:hypothetical protein
MESGRLAQDTGRMRFASSARSTNKVQLGILQIASTSVFYATLSLSIFLSRIKCAHQIHHVQTARIPPLSLRHPQGVAVGDKLAGEKPERAKVIHRVTEDRKLPVEIPYRAFPPLEGQLAGNRCVVGWADRKLNLRHPSTSIQDQKLFNPVHCFSARSSLSPSDNCEISKRTTLTGPGPGGHR